MRKERDIFSGLGQESNYISNKDVENHALASHKSSNDDGHPLDSKDDQKEEPQTVVMLKGRNQIIERSIDGISINLLKGDLNSIMSKRKYTDFFHQIHLSHQSAHFLGRGDFKKIFKHIESTCKVRPIISAETGKFIFPLQRKDRDVLNSKILEMGTANGLLPVGIDESSSHVSHDLNVICFELGLGQT